MSKEDVAKFKAMIEKSKADMKREEEENRPFDKAKHDEEMKKLHGTGLVVASMQDNGDIWVSTTYTGEQGGTFHGSTETLPTEAGYEETKSEYKVFKPGDVTRRSMRYIDKAWVVEEELCMSKEDWEE